MVGGNTMQIERFTNQDMIDVHGNMFFYREMYKGNHGDIFPRAKDLIRRGEVIDKIRYGSEQQARKLQTPYLIANISKMIVDIPTLFINRSLGKAITNLQTEQFEDEENLEAIEMNQNKTKRQQEMIDEITDNSKLIRQHGMNIRQWQIDGGIVAVPEIINGKPQISFKERNIYYELDDGKTFQLRYKLEYDKKNYIHVHEEVENETSVDGTHYLYKMGVGQRLELIEDPAFVEEVTGIPPEQQTYELEDRNRTLFIYLPNDPTFDNKFGYSSLEGQENKQDEVNWTITRTSQIFERNGKPRISVTKDVWQQLEAAAMQKHGDITKIDHRNLEITTIDESGNSLEVHQIDVSKIGDMDYVKDIIKFMLMETQTSEKAIDFFSDEGSAYAQSGTAKFYDLFLSLMKAERLRDEYVDFIRQSFENCLWLASVQDATIDVERPDIEQKEMLPITSQERRDMNNATFDVKAQSLETTVRNINPEKSEEWIKHEVERIEGERTSTDSFGLLNGNQSAFNFNDNRNSDGEHVDDEGNPIED